MLHKVSWACSPINKTRLRDEFYQLNYANEFGKSSINRARVEEEEEEEGEEEEEEKEEEKRCIQIPQHESYLLWTLRHPILTFRLIKRYHMIGNVTIIFHIMFSLALIHICTKATFFLYIGDDRETLNYFKSIYYPHLAQRSRKPSSFDSSFLTFGFLFLGCRIRNFCRLVRQAIINANSYKELHVPQLNLAYMTTFNLTLTQWLDIWKYTSEHNKSIKSSEEKYKNHIGFSAKANENLFRCFDKYYAYYYNFIDFEECYSGLKFMKSTQDRRIEAYKLWHLAYPANRISIADLRYISITLFYLSLLSYFGLATVCFIDLYIDISGYFPHDYSPPLNVWIVTTLKHFSSLTHVIRASEISFLFFCQLPQVFETIKVGFDIYLTTSRTRKLVEAFRLHLKYCRMMERESMFELGTTTNDWKIPYDPRIERTYSRIESKRSLNEHILRDINLSRLQYLEFLNIREYHSSFLNILVLGSGICIPFTIITAFKDIDNRELIITSISLFACLAPLIINLLFCAGIEKTVSI